MVFLPEKAGPVNGIGGSLASQGGRMFVRLTPHLCLRTRLRPYVARPGERVLVLEAARVFPPGHPTTCMCLELLAEWVPILQPRTVLDVGTGSGVLALAAAALGAEQVIGVDPCPRAVQLTRANARRNGLGEVIRAIRGTASCLKGPFPVLAANLPFAVLAAEAGNLSRLASPEAALILSGFRDVQEEELLLRLRPGGWQLTARRTRDDWPLVLPPEGSFTWVAWVLRRSGKGGPKDR